METYYLSYNPNDFFWVSVSGDYNLSVCEDMIRPKMIRFDTKLGFQKNSEVTTDSGCPCATSTPTPLPDNGMHYIQDTHIFKKNNYTDDPYYYQLCANKVYSDDLKKIQISTSEGHQLYTDGNDKYFSQVLQITNICIGIVAMAILVRV
jgi:hypothetical protein